MVNTSQMIGASLGTALLNSLAVSAVAGYLTAHAGQARAATYAATHSYDVVFTISAAVLLIGSVLIGALARGDLPGRTVTAAANGPSGAMRRIGETA
jgi:hypothetical protein